jgi:hypothetical protein
MRGLRQVVSLHRSVAANTAWSPVCGGTGTRPAATGEFPCDVGRPSACFGFAHEREKGRAARCKYVVSLGSRGVWCTFAMRVGHPTLGVFGRFKIYHSEPAIAMLEKLDAACLSCRTSTPRTHCGLA